MNIYAHQLDRIAKAVFVLTAAVFALFVVLAGLSEEGYAIPGALVAVLGMGAAAGMGAIVVGTFAMLAYTVITEVYRARKRPTS